MPKAEYGTPKYVAKRMKARGLQKLRWYCQVCEKQCRDENGFKCHNQSPSHTRKVNEAKDGGRPGVMEYSRQFKHDFIYLLRVSHGEKSIEANKFYNEYIQNKEHVHMNATKWPSLTAFVWHVAREGICKVDETSRGLMISWLNPNLEAKLHESEIAQQASQRTANEERAYSVMLGRVKSQDRASPTPGQPPAVSAPAAAEGTTISFNVANTATSKKVSPLKLK